MQLGKVYLAIDEGGVHAEIGSWLVASIRSIRRNTSMVPVVLYAGRLEDPCVERWRSLGAEVIRGQSRLLDAVERKIADNVLPTRARGVFLRYEIPRLAREAGERWALYVDCDVIFRRSPSFPEVKLLGAAVTSQGPSGPHFNSGVLVYNTQAFEAEEPALLAFLESTLGKWLPSSLDEQALNHHFRGRFEELPAELNWRPFFGPGDPELLHFHGLRMLDLANAATGDFRGRRDLLEHGNVIELSRHLRDSLPGVLHALPELQAQQLFAGTGLENALEQLQEAERRSLGNLMSVRSQRAQAAVLLRQWVEGLAPGAQSLPFQHAELRYQANAPGAARIKLHPGAVVGFGRLQLRVLGAPGPVRLGWSPDLDVKVETGASSAAEQRFTVTWAGLGVDCHFVLACAEGPLGPCTVEVVSTGVAAGRLLACWDEGGTFRDEPSVSAPYA